jgi:2-polyprenyl-3-methyl-5-hydroxy-6-metoxy-1,4-benzoquinol methylase
MECFMKNLAKKLLFSGFPLPAKRRLSRILLNKENNFKLTSLLNCDLKKNWYILDIGSGTGDFVYDLHELGFERSVGIDPFLDHSICYEARRSKSVILLASLKWRAAGSGFLSRITAIER